MDIKQILANGNIAKFIKRIKKGGINQTPFFVYLVLINNKEITVNYTDSKISIDGVNFFDYAELDLLEHIEQLSTTSNTSYYLYLFEYSMLCNIKYEKSSDWESIKKQHANKAHALSLSNILDGYGCTTKVRSLLLKYSGGPK